MITKRFESLTIDTRRVRANVDAGRVAPGDFLQAYDRLVQREVLARPGGRGALARGDADRWGGLAWRVAAVVDGDPIVEVERGGELFSVIPGSDPEFGDLFRPITEEEAWAQHRTRLDLWDWIPGAPAGPGPAVRPADDGFQVEAAGGAFTWVPSRGANIVGAHPGAPLPSRDAISALFVGPVVFE